jgi:hypothetical protein
VSNADITALAAAGLTSANEQGSQASTAVRLMSKRELLERISLTSSLDHRCTVREWTATRCSERKNRVGVDDGMRSIVASKRASDEHWPIPKQLPSDLASVDAFALDFLPDRLAPWIDDIATRLQCPPDYPAITAMTALGAILGRKIGIKPQLKTDWIEIPNVWGAFIGPLACSSRRR